MLPSEEARAICDVTLDGPRAGGGFHGESSRAKGEYLRRSTGAIARRPGRPRGGSSMSSVRVTGLPPEVGHPAPQRPAARARRGPAPPAAPRTYGVRRDPGADRDLGGRGLSLVRAAQGACSRCGCPGPAAGSGCGPGVPAAAAPSARGRSTGAWRPIKRQLTTRRYGRTKPGTLLKHHIPAEDRSLGRDHPRLHRARPRRAWRPIGRMASSRTRSTSPTSTRPGWRRRAVLGRGEAPRPGGPGGDPAGVCPSGCGASTPTTGRSSSTSIYRLLPGPGDSVHARAGPTRRTTTPTSSRRTGRTSASSWGTCATTRPRARGGACNALYRHELRLFQNLFLPSVKLVRKERVGARLRRRYDAPRTPLERVLALPRGGSGSRRRVVGRAPRSARSLRPGPQAIDRKIERLVALATVPRPRPTRPRPGAAAAGGRIVRRRRRRRPAISRHPSTTATAYADPWANRPG